MRELANFDQNLSDSVEARQEIDLRSVLLYKHMNIYIHTHRNFHKNLSDNVEARQEIDLMSLPLFNVTIAV
jgi:hypothetical protein